MTTHDQKYHEKTKVKEPAALAKRLEKLLPKNSCIVDLGAGAGVDSIYFAQNGHKAIAIDREITVVSEMVDRQEAHIKERLSVLKGDFYHMEIPAGDAVYANYSLPFCEAPLFFEKWSTLESQFQVGAVIAVVFFGKRDDWRKNTSKFSFHSEEDVLKLLSHYQIIEITDREYEGQSMGPSGDVLKKHWHVIDVIARKLR